MRARIEASGGDPALIPDEPAALWRLRIVMERTGLARPTLYRLAAAGQFPKPVRLSDPRAAQAS
jgi:predicted DNA-binding transcriptional regulator AlpA